MLAFGASVLHARPVSVSYEIVDNESVLGYMKESEFESFITGQSHWIEQFGFSFLSRYCLASLLILTPECCWITWWCQHLIYLQPCPKAKDI